MKLMFYVIADRVAYFDMKFLNPIKFSVINRLMVVDVIEYLVGLAIVIKTLSSVKFERASDLDFFWNLKQNSKFCVI